MKYNDLIFKDILSKKDWKSTTQIKRDVEKKSKKSINWYTVHYILEGFLRDKKVEKITSGNVTLWKKR